MRLLGMILAISFLVIGCSQKTEEELWQEAVQLQKEDNTDAALEAYRAMVEAHPKGSRAAEALYAMGTMAQNAKRDYHAAIGYYRRLVTDFPEHATASNAAFMIGFIYNNDLKLTDSAKIAYELFLQKYPNSQMVVSAQFELETLGKSPEQILAERAAAETRKAKPSKKSSK